MTSTTAIRSVWIALAAAAIGVSVATASSLAGVASGSLASGDDAVTTPPVVVDDIRMIEEFEDTPGPPEFRLRQLHVDFLFPAAFFGKLNFHAAITGLSPLPVTRDNQHEVDVGAGEIFTVIFQLDSADIPIAAVEDIHLMVCDHDSVSPDSVCRRP